MHLILLFIFLLSACGRSDYDSALAAYDKGEYQVAFEMLEPLAESGDAKAQNMLGLIYEKEDGIGQDYEKAIEWYQKAATQGWDDAASRAGRISRRIRHSARSAYYAPRSGSYASASASKAPSVTYARCSMLIPALFAPGRRWRSCCGRPIAPMTPCKSHPWQ